VKGRPDLEWFTSVKAKEVTFGKLSDERKVTYYGEPDHETEVEVERENIPEDPEVGVTYRDVKVDWTVLQRIVHPIEEDDAEDEEDEAASSGESAAEG
jgi:hypothetical protein